MGFGDSGFASLGLGIVLVLEAWSSNLFEEPGQGAAQKV